MPRYVVLRISQAVVTLLLLVTAVFVLVRLAPGDPAAAMVGPQATNAQLDAMRAEMGLDKSIFRQYLMFIGNVAHGDLGESVSYGRPAATVVLERVPYSLLLASAAMLIAVLIAVPLGIFMARSEDSVFDTAASMLTIGGQSLPDFWLGIMLIFGFAVTFPIFPTSGFQSWSALVLPATTVAVLQLAVIARVVRSEMVTTLHTPYVARARGQGMSEWGLTSQVALKNSAVPVVTAIGTRFASLVNGVVVIEVVFSWPGLGSLVVQALQDRDYALIQAAVVISAALTMTFQLLVDLSYPLLDPRIRLGKASERT
ncbi:MAG: ABC transporter permease [Nocardioidaceae bacterium]|nr:MAG: ABC transporter permease [Nocardioidaceae bacterium]